MLTVIIFYNKQFRRAQRRKTLNNRANRLNHRVFWFMTSSTGLMLWPFCKISRPDKQLVLQTIGQSDLKKLVGEEYRSAKIYYLSHFFKYIFHHFSCRIHFWCKINFDLYQLWIVFMMNKKNYSSYKHWNFIIKNFVLNLILLFFYNKNIQT